MRRLATAAVLVLPTLNALPAAAAPPAEAERSGRFIMQPVDGGVVRMDQDTGAISMCVKRGTAFTCEAVEDKPLANKEIERLAGENRELRAEIKRLEDRLALDKPGADNPERRAHKFELPSEQDLDKAMTYVERMLKKFREKLKDLESGTGKGTPL